MTQLFPLREKPSLAPYKKGDVLVLFGELFSRGYANGLVDEAERLGMTIVRATVGRREKDGSLRALNEEETALVPQPFINVPLEAGFDMEPDSQGQTPVDQTKDIKMSDWQNAKLNWQSIEESRQNGIKRFRKNTELFLSQLEKHIPPGANVVFAHLMAGGVPRTKIIMPVMNRVFKGTGDRFISSAELYESELGKFALQNFSEVTAETFRHLVDLSTPLRQKLESQGSHVSYTAYGYHGTEVMIQEEYRWQTYTPYFQGWAKKELEQISAEFFKKGIHCCVYNCPEILTNSTTIFQGVEVSLYPLLRTLQKHGGDKKHAEQVLNQCQSLLKEGVTFDQVIEITDTYLTNPLILKHSKLDQWPQNSSKDHMEYMLGTSDKLIALHKDEKQLMTAVLSEVVFKACGYVMLHTSWKPQHPYTWINHDLVAKTM